MRFTFFLTILLISWTCLSFAQGSKPIIDLPIPGSSLTPGQQLQDTVNNPANTNVIIRLGRGTYLLDPTTPPAGRLSLQQGMEIVGENQYIDCDGDGVWDPITCAEGPANPEDLFTLADSQTLIDGSLITMQMPVPGSAQTMPNGLLRLGRDNSISRVSIRGANTNNVFGNVHINLQSDTGPVRATVTDSILEGGSRGIYCQNPEGNLDGTSASATLKRNIVRNNMNGIQVQNANWDGNIWEAVVKYNRIYNNRMGIFVIGNQTAFASTQVNSSHNLIELNRLGILVLAGQDGGGMRPAFGLMERGGTNNLFSFVSQKDIVKNNIGNIGIPNLGGNRLGGGVVVIAGSNVTSAVSPSSGNKLVIQFIDTRFQDNLWKPAATHPGYLSHVSAFGYWTFQNREIGSYNTTRVRVRLDESDQTLGGFWQADSIPFESAGTNKAIVFSSNVEFVDTDPQGFPAE